MYYVHYKDSAASVTFTTYPTLFPSEAAAKARIEDVLSYNPRWVMQISKVISTHTAAIRTHETRHDATHLDDDRTDRTDQSADQPDSHADDGNAS